MTMPQYAARQAQAPPARPPRMQGLSFLVHGLAKAGKTSFGDSGPVPRLIVDVEGSSYWTPSRKVYWNPRAEAPPRPDGSWDTAVVLAREARDIHETYRWLDTGQHAFNSASIDSVTEMQQRLIDDKVGTRQVKLDEWGAILREVSSITRAWRDLINHPVKPVWAVTFLAGSKLYQPVNKWRPMVQGQVGDFLPYYVDVLGHLSASPDNTRWMLIGPHPQFETGERVGGRLPDVMQLAYPGRFQGYTIESMLAQVLAGRY